MSDDELQKRAIRVNSLPEDEVFQNMLLNRLYASFDKLSNRQRKRAILYFISDLTYKQIAEIESRSIATIKESIDDAKRKIIKDLKYFFD